MADTKQTKTKASVETKTETIEHQPESAVAHAASEWADTLREAGKSVAESAVAMQDRNVQFAQSLVEQGFKQVEDQTKALHSLYTTVTSHSGARRAAFRELAREAVSASGAFLVSPARIYRRAIERVREAGEEREGVEN